jgi:preprotein translocase subunit SecG
MSILINILIAFHLLVCLLMVGVVLMQRPKNEGLGAAFGGGMTENIFGAQTTHVLQKFTVWLGIVFFAITLTLAMLYARNSAGETGIQRELLSQPVPVAEEVVVTTDPIPVPEVVAPIEEEEEAPAAATDEAPAETEDPAVEDTADESEAAPVAE